MPLFQTGIPEALLKFVTLLHKTIQGHYLSTGSQKFGITRKLVVGEALRVFEEKTLVRIIETNADYELVIKYFIARFSPPKALQLQKRYLQRGLYKPCDTKIREFVCHIDNTVEYL